MFVTLAERAEKDAKDGRRPAHSPEELLAAAITGWHLGKVAAETKVGTAYKCWMTRQMALDYLRTPQRGGREAMLKHTSSGLTPWLTTSWKSSSRCCRRRTPPRAPTQRVTTSRSPPSVDVSERGDVRRSAAGRIPAGPVVPAADPASPDPVTDRTPDELLAEFGDLPAGMGTSSPSPQWWDPIKSTYSYSQGRAGDRPPPPAASAADLPGGLGPRVHLWATAKGRSMALDSGPVAPGPVRRGSSRSTRPSFGRCTSAAEYWVNFHQLPVYMIMGDKFGPSVNAIRMLSERWMPRGFPALVVSYKGRGQEWFSEELPYAFDWMGRKRRADPGKMVGPPRFEGKTVAAGFSSVRLTDNRFHWLSSGRHQAGPDDAARYRTAERRPRPSSRRRSWRATRSRSRCSACGS